MVLNTELAEQILAVISLIPKGRVATYGQIAKLAGLPKHARLVGKVLQQIEPDTQIAWYRVINAQGQIRTTRCNMQGENLQKIQLIEEGICVISNKIDLNVYLWVP